MRRRFVRAARRALAPIIAADRPVALPEFEIAMGGALVQFRTGLAPDRPDDAASLEAGITLLGAGIELILRRAGRLPMRDRTAPTVPSSGRESELPTLSRLRSSIQAAISRCLLELRRDPLDPAAVRATARDITTLQGELAPSNASSQHVLREIGRIRKALHAATTRSAQQRPHECAPSRQGHSRRTRSRTQPLAFRNRGLMMSALAMSVCCPSSNAWALAASSSNGKRAIACAHGLHCGGRLRCLPDLAQSCGDVRSLRSFVNQLEPPPNTLVIGR